MQKIIENVLFKKYEGFWMSNLRFDNVETTFEILTDEINETLVKEIISNLDSRILLLKNESIDILIPL